MIRLLTRRASVPHWAKNGFTTRRIQRALSSAVETEPSSNEERIVVTTYKRLRIPTDAPSHRIPLSIVDTHLRYEQLPFCYFFEQTLDEQELQASLQKVLQSSSFSATGGKICESHLAIQIQPDDIVNLSFGRINTTLKHWNSQQRGHVHQSTQHPTLLPIFDALFEHDERNGMDTSLMRIRITYFQHHGTAIAVNFNHLLGDTSSCVQFVQSWGKQMRSKEFQTACNNRSRASISGMMTAEIAEVMGLTPPPPLDGNNTNYVPSFLQNWFEVAGIIEPTEVSIDATTSKDLPLPPPTQPGDGIHHEYVRLIFPPALLKQLKAIGNFSCLQDDAGRTTQEQQNLSFVSTNDMVTAFGWLMKRHLSQHSSHSISMVVNLRGRSPDVSSFMFGNGITHIVATLPTTTYKPENALPGAGDDEIETLCQAAKAIRSALHLGLSDVSDSLSMSQMGRPTAPPANSTESFSTTSWGQFPLYKVRFGEHAPLCDFHGHPSHPLPVGRTFASVIMPRADGGFWYEMLVPCDRAAQANKMHREMSTLCMQWRKPTDTANSVSV
jgi:Transferase family